MAVVEEAMADQTIATVAAEAMVLLKPVVNMALPRPPILAVEAMVRPRRTAPVVEDMVVANPKAMDAPDRTMKKTKAATMVDTMANMARNITTTTRLSALNDSTLVEKRRIKRPATAARLNTLNTRRVPSRKLQILSQ